MPFSVTGFFDVVRSFEKINNSPIITLYSML